MAYESAVSIRAVFVALAAAALAACSEDSSRSSGSTTGAGGSGNASSSTTAAGGNGGNDTGGGGAAGGATGGGGQGGHGGGGAPQSGRCPSDIAVDADIGQALPTAIVDIEMPMPTGATIAVAAGDDLQAALDSAALGDVIEI